MARPERASNRGFVYQLSRSDRVDPSITGGLTVTVVGVVTVFAALASLTTLVTVINVLGKSRDGTASKAVETDEVAGSAARVETGDAPTANAGTEDTAAQEDLTLVALAAYALHRRHRVASGSARPANEWVRANRVRNTASFQR